MGDSIDNIKGVPGHRRKRRARPDRNLRQSRGPARARRRDHEQAIPRGAAESRRRRAAEPRAGAHPDRRAGRLRSGRGALPRRLAGERASSSSTRLGFRIAGHGVRPDGGHGRQGLCGWSTPPTRLAALVDRARDRPAASRSASFLTHRPRCAPASSGSRSRRRARRARYVPVARQAGPAAAGSSTALMRQTAKGNRGPGSAVLDGAEAVARGSIDRQGRARPEVRCDRARAARRRASRHRDRHDARQLPASTRRAPRIRSRSWRWSTPATRR